MRRRLSSRLIDPYDDWLESQGLYRKQIARDGSCLFRAVAEQVTVIILYSIVKLGYNVNAWYGYTE